MKCISILTIVFLMSGNAYVQLGEIKGKILDEKGEPVPFALVIVIKDEAGKERTSKGSKANADGDYRLKDLPYGKYNLMAISVGRKIEIKKGIDLLNPVRNLDFCLAYKNPSICTLSYTRDRNSLQPKSNEIKQQDLGSSLNAGDGRKNDVVYFVDCIRQTPNICYRYTCGNANQRTERPLVKVEKPTIYPNPSTGIFKIQSTSKVENIRVYDQRQNMLVLNGENPLEVDLTRYQDGFYYIHYQLGNEIKSEKLELRR
jgi:hypothetical protein